ncbi:MAG: alpha/beta fold hydrolase [Ignavibacteriaceae bacterium]|nr:alpha/beta fold hydrolase [Ignavibacteriaceae bacterium]
MSLLRLIVFLLFAHSISLYSQGELRTQNIGDLELTGGGVIKDCKVAYRVFGSANSDSSNIVIYPTWFAGNTEQLRGLMGKGKIVDTSHYCVIALDALGDGFSSSPSNSNGLFPVISIKDMVNSQYILLTKYLKVMKIHAAIGGSMGGMQVYQWLMSYPSFMKKAVPYVGTPRPAVTDMAIWHNQLAMIETAEKCSLPQEEVMRAPNLVMNLFAYTHEYRNERTNRDSFFVYYNGHRKPQPATFTVENYKAQLRAMMSHDIYDGAMPEDAVKKIKAEVFVIAGKYDNLVYHGPAAEFAKLTGSKLYLSESNCGHICVGCELSTVSEMIDEFLKK